MSPAKAPSRREWILACLGIVLLAVGVHLTPMANGSAHDMVLPGSCRTPIRVLEPRAPRVTGSAVVFHGLSANRRMMQTAGQWLAELGLRVYLVDSPGHGDSTEPFSYARAEQCAAAAVDSLARRGAISAESTVLVGHSMGGAIAVRLADRFPVAATVAISPAPMNLPRRMPVNLLILSAQLDMKMLKDTARELLRAAGGERSAAEDFRQRRAVRLAEIPYTTHTSLLYDRRVGRVFSDWLPKALGGEPPLQGDARGYPVAGSVLGLIGLLLMFPLVASGVELLFAAGKSSAPEVAKPAAGGALLRWAIAALLAVGVLSFWVPLHALRMLTGAYLASFLLLAGVALLALLWKNAKSALHFDVRAMLTAGALAAAAAVAFGLWINWQLDDAWPNAVRWLRFVPLVLACWPYLLAEAVALGPPGKRNGPAAEQAGHTAGRRFILFVAMQLVLWLALAFALFALGSGQILVLLLAVFLALFAVFERLGSDAVWRRTGSASAAAFFGAILMAWFIAAVFPLT